MQPLEKWIQIGRLLAVLGLGLLLSFAQGIFDNSWFYALFLCSSISLVSLLLGYLIHGLIHNAFSPFTFPGLFGLLISVSLFGCSLADGQPENNQKKLEVELDRTSIPPIAPSSESLQAPSAAIVQPQKDSLSILVSKALKSQEVPPYFKEVYRNKQLMPARDDRIMLALTDSLHRMDSPHHYFYFLALTYSMRGSDGFYSDGVSGSSFSFLEEHLDQWLFYFERSPHLEEIDFIYWAQSIVGELFISEPKPLTQTLQRLDHQWESRAEDLGKSDTYRKLKTRLWQVFRRVKEGKPSIPEQLLQPAEVTTEVRKGKFSTAFLSKLPELFPAYHSVELFPQVMVLNYTDTVEFPQPIAYNDTVFFQAEGSMELALFALHPGSLGYRIRWKQSDDTLSSRSGETHLQPLFFYGAESDTDPESGLAYFSTEYFDEGDNCAFSIRIGKRESNGIRLVKVTNNCENWLPKLELQQSPTLVER